MSQPAGRPRDEEVAADLAADEPEHQAFKPRAGDEEVGSRAGPRHDQRSSSRIPRPHPFHHQHPRQRPALVHARQSLRRDPRQPLLKPHERARRRAAAHGDPLRLHDVDLRQSELRVPGVGDVAGRPGREVPQAGNAGGRGRVRGPKAGHGGLCGVRARGASHYVDGWAGELVRPVSHVRGLGFAPRLSCEGSDTRRALSTGFDK
mmetsp:Transcript_10175/g.25532  ORF Transcript_10175/g.25532 Transcript_10175/m.25532 type:complete len:205 (+) Transcript_10175:203-817(+)